MWKVLMCLSLVGGCWAGSESWLNNIGRNLRADMMNVMEMGYVNYSEPNINTTYVSKSEFDMRAMGHLYNSTHIIIDTIVSEQAYPEGIVSVSDGHVEFTVADGKWRTLLAHYAGPVAVVAVAALLVAILPLAGLFWCCCHWCRSGRRRRSFDRKYDACFKGILAILLIALLTLFLFGVVCAFVTEEQAESGARDAADALRAGAKDARSYLNATQAHARWILVNNYKELENKLNAMLTSCGLTVSLQLGEFSRAVSVTTLYTMVQQLDAVQSNLRQVQNLTIALRLNAEKLNSGLRRVKGQLLQTLKRCDQPTCIKLQDKYKIGQLDTEIPYSQMPNVSELLNNVTSLLDSNIKAEVGEGQKVFSEIQRGIQRSLDEHIPSVQEAITATGARLAAVADNITAAANAASEQTLRADTEADRIQRIHETYGAYRLYLGRATAAALLLMVVILTWGLICGVCGKRADAYSADACCHKPHGARSLLCGMGTMFLLGGAVALVMLVYFLIGITTQRFICDPIREPRGNRLFSDLEVFVDLETQVYQEHQEPAFNITSVLISCHQNNTIYETLQLHRISALDSVSASVSAEVSRKVGSLRPAFPPDYIQILKPSARDKLTRLADTGLSTFNFDRILSALETNMTSLSLEGLATQLEAAAAGARPGMRGTATELNEAAVLLRHYHQDIVLPMRADTTTLNETTVRLRDGMRFNHSSLKHAIAYLMDETEQAEKFLNTLGPELIHNMTREFGSVVSGLVQGYTQRARHAAEFTIGACGPLSHALNSTRDALCVNVLMPVNGYWISLAWCLLLFAPILLVSQKLAKLYSHADPYPGPLVEAEYLYDAYADRDNVPLANAYKAEKRSGRSGRARGEAPGVRGAGGEGARGEGARGEGARAAPPLDAHHARRYNDMAPKHWEEGPPRYHGPTEYERPPPYYYPGPNDRQ